MKLEIRHLESQLSYQIDPEGAVLGRERARTDIAVADKSVSKRHARIYEKGGQWYLEDLGSSNGTFLNAQRISEPVLLAPGVMFALSENQFQVVQIVGEDNHGGPPPRLESDALLYDIGPDAADAGGLDREPDVVGRSALDVEVEDSGLVVGLSDDGEPPPEKKGFQHFFIAFPKAIGYYLAATPIMAVNPIGTVRKGIREPKMPAMGPIELSAYALPANLFTAAVGFIATVIVQLVAGTLSIGDIIPIGPLVGAVIGSAIAGFLLHPVLGWLVRFLKGTSTYETRTNFFLMAMTAAILFSIPTGLAIVLPLIPVPFIAIVPIAITLVAQLLMTFISYSWFKFFGVAKWFQILILLGGVGSCYTAAMQLKTVVTTTLNAPSTDTPADPDTTTPTDPDAPAEAETDELAKAQAELEAAAKQKIEDGETTKTADPDSEKTPEKAPVEKSPEKAPEKAPVEKAPVERAPPAPREVTAPPAFASDVPSADARVRNNYLADEEIAKSLSEMQSAPTGFMRFLRKRDAVERAVEIDPTLLDDKSILKNYTTLQRESNVIRSKWKRKKKSVGESKVHTRQKDAEVYRETEKYVDRLYNEIFDKKSKKRSRKRRRR